MIPDGITLTVGPNESQYQLARRAFILIARMVPLDPSDQIAFADAFVPANLNTPSFTLEWIGRSDPSPTDSRGVKAHEFNKVRATQVSLTLTTEQKDWLIRRAATRRPFATSLLFGTQLGTNFWENPAVNGNNHVENADIPESLRSALRIFETEALNFSTRFINDARVRQDYLRQTKEVAEEILGTFMRGEVTEQEAANIAHRLRDGIMDASRLRTSDIGLARAQARN